MRRKQITGFKSAWIALIEGQLSKNVKANCWWGYGKKEALAQYCWNLWAHPLWKTVWRLLKKLKKELGCDPAITLLDLYWNCRTGGHGLHGKVLT
jgi:hypothetical protein